MTSKRMPAIFLPHGGGPWPFVNKPLFGPEGTWDAMATYMRGLGQVPPEPPRAVLVISAHWEEAQPTVMSAPKPPMLYDYYNFPPEAYEVQWPAPGAPEVADEVRTLLHGAGFETAANAERGFDHGVFVPLKLGYPKADIPTLQLSLRKGLDPREHLAIGRALAPLRDQGVFLIGSGMSYHNMRGLMTASRGAGAAAQRASDDSKAFDEWLQQTVALDEDKRDTRLAEWESAPAARASHPREEHLLPLHVIAGAAGEQRGTVPYRDHVMGVHICGVHFG